MKSKYSCCFSADVICVVLLKQRKMKLKGSEKEGYPLKNEIVQLDTFTPFAFMHIVIRKKNLVM